MEKFNKELVTPQELATYLKMILDNRRNMTKKEKEQKILNGFAESFNQYVINCMQLTTSTTIKSIQIPLISIAEEYQSITEDGVKNDRLLGIIEDYLTKQGWKFHYENVDMIEGTPGITLEFNYQKLAKESKESKNSEVKNGTRSRKNR